MGLKGTCGPLPNSMLRPLNKFDPPELVRGRDAPSDKDTLLKLLLPLNILRLLAGAVAVYNLQVVDEWVFITGDSTNSLTKISLSGEKVKTFVTGIDSVTGLDVTTWNLAGGVEGGYKIFFAM